MQQLFSPNVTLYKFWIWLLNFCFTDYLFVIFFVLVSFKNELDSLRTPK